MANLGGYLAVSYVAEHVFIDALDALWRVDWEASNGVSQWSTATPFGQLQADGGVSLDKPEMKFRGISNDIGLHLTGAGRFELTLAGVAAGGVFVEVDAAVSAPVRVTQAAVYRKAVVDLSGVTLDAVQLRVSWFDGPHHPNAEPALLSDAARAALTSQFRTRAARYLTFQLPTDQLWLAELTLMTTGNPGSIIITPQIELGDVRILDGWFALGIDATSSISATHGTAFQIGPPPDAPPQGTAPLKQADPGDGSLRLIIDPAVALTYLQANAKFAVTIAAASKPSIHPNNDDLHVALEDDTIVVHASGSVDAPDPFPGRMPFTADVRVRPFIPLNARTVYASIKPDVRVDAPWYLKVLGAIADLFGADSFAALRRANKTEMAILFGVEAHQNLPDVSAVSARIEGRQLAIRPDLLGVFGEIALTTSFSEPSRAPTPSVWGGVRIRDRFLRLEHANRRLQFDPTFQIRYTVRRSSNGTQVTSGVAWSGTAGPFGEQIDMWDDANVLETAYTVELTAERPPGTVVAQHVQSVAVIDPFDRSHPFVRWSKQHYYTGNPRPVTILSAIHRTAIRERCKFCDVRTARFKTPYVMEAVDSLPAPDEDGFSSRLCKYCFPNG